ncbi:Phosphatidate cytidylyltransferase [Durusdinium trenchii]|uniref:Phosphatidate cytidylyltransferase n=1 Tax=Durusdinium trenchii TaxID=1381693 RepID=A0ABP0IMU6_9DINO
MAVWWEPNQDELADRNGESPFVLPDFLEGSNFQHLYKGNGEPRAVDGKELAASFALAVNAFVQHYWTCLKDYEVTLDHQVEGSGHVALEEMMPRWHDDLVDHFRVGLDPEATIKMYTSGTMVAIRRVFRHFSLEDSPNVLRAVMKIIMDINYFINSVHHEGGVFYSGVGIGESLRLVEPGAKLRMPRFLSTTTELKFAKSRLTDKVGPALLVIRIPHGFWGARDISAFSSCPEENETMFCAYALFHVERVSSIKMQGQEVTRIDLKALDKYEGIDYTDDAFPPFHHAPIEIDELEAHESYVRQYS